MEYMTLNNGVKMPMIGFGVFQVPDANRLKQLSAMRWRSGTG